MKKEEKEKIQKVTEFLNTPGHVCFSSIIGFILWWFKSFSVDPIVLLNARCWGWGLVFAVQTQSSGSRSLQRIDSLSGLSASGLGLLFRFWNWSRHLWTKTKTVCLYSRFEPETCRTGDANMTRDTHLDTFVVTYEWFNNAIYWLHIVSLLFFKNGA